MAAAVAEAIGQGKDLIVEAGTGIGKSLAYLAPALMSGRQVVVSTATKNLQEQLFFKDLPLVREALGQPLRVALLKGRANYLCLYRLKQTAAQGYSSLRLASQLQAIDNWSAATDTGDLSEVGDVSDSSPLWPAVTSSADNCLGSGCPRYSDCFVVKARQRAQGADLVVVNHHLLFADMALRETGFAELLPSAEVVVLDEAHKVPEIAAQFFGAAVRARQLRELCRDAHTEYREIAEDNPAFTAAVQELESRVDALARTLGGAQSERLAWEQIGHSESADRALSALDQALSEAQEAMQAVAERSRGLENCARRAGELQLRLRRILGEDEDNIRWAEVWANGFVLRLTPLEVAPAFTQAREQLPASWIFTSATLAVDGDFEHFRNQLGLGRAQSLCLSSPYDYERNALLYLPKNMPQPNSTQYVPRLIDAVLPVIQATDGGAFVLCTSYRALEAVASELETLLDAPVFKQGDAGRNELLQSFREAGNAVLVGTSSFWEGVDVRGEALSLVVIDRLPFAAPSDPVLEARIKAIRRQGGNPFMDYQLPQAVISLKQGIGRLIRDENDRGVLMICDPRIKTKPYGRMFMQSLPDMPITDEIVKVRSFLSGERE